VIVFFFPLARINTNTPHYARIIFRSISFSKSSDTMDSSPPHPFKIILVGDLAVGKTSLVNAFTNVPFEIRHLATVGYSGSQTPISVDGETILLNIWDTAGSEAYSALVPFYARGAVVAIVVASAVDMLSIERIDNWVSFATNGSPRISIIVAINKQDLLPEADFLHDTCAELEGRYENVMLVSAKTGVHVADLFEKAARLAKGQAAVRQPDVDISPMSGSCC
jgi:small GTP-binding protein